MKKKSLLLILVTIMISFVLVSCNNKKGIALNGPKELTINIDEEVKLNITATSNKKYSESDILNNLEYTSKDSSIVNIDNGVVKGLKPGTTIISVVWNEDENVKLDITVKVLTPEVSDVEVITPSPLVIKVGETKEIKIVCDEKLIVKWHSKNESIATVKDGVVTAQSVGSTVIEIEISNGYKTITKTVEVNVSITVSKVTYILDGGTNNELNPTTYIEGTIVKLEDPTKEGYKFLGWYLNDVLVTSISNDQKGDIELVAKWEYIKKTYNITYNLDGGTNNELNPSSYVEGEEVILKEATKEGYKFLGWYLNDVLVTTINKEQKGDVELVAKWEYIKKSYNITYVLDGGTNSELNPPTYLEGETVTLHEATKEGYDFLGWYLNDVLVTTIDSTQKGDIELTAKFKEKENIELTYELNGGTFEWTVGDVTNPKGGIAAVSNLPTIFMQDFYYYLKTNKLLESDKVAKSLSQKGFLWSGFSADYTDPKALYNWTSTTYYSATDGYSQLFWDSLSNNLPVGGFFGTSPYKEKYATLHSLVLALTTIKYSDLDITSANGKSGFAFVLDGYFYGTQGLMSSGNNKDIFNQLRGLIPTMETGYIDPTKSLTEIKKYQYQEIITSTPYGTKINLVLPTREGYAFMGWYDNASLTGTPLTSVSNNATVYAKWFDLNAPLPTHNISYVLDDGAVEDAPTSYIEGIGIETLPTPSKAGYDFLGWTKVKGSTDYVTSISKYDDEDITLYANFKEVSDLEITYIYEEGDTPTHKATSLAEFAETFWEEFYIWSKQTTGIEAFKTTVLNSWKSNKAGSFKLYKGNAKNQIDNDYFVNTKGNDLWMAWFNIFDSQVTSINSAQSAWASTWVGYIRLYEVFMQTKSYWTEERTRAVYEGYPIHEKLVKRFKPGDEITLVELVVEDGRTFLGWYDNEGNKVETTKGLTKNITLTARWSASTPVEKFEVTNKISKLLRLTSHQLTWEFTPENATNKKVKFVSSNPDVISIDENGLMYGIKDGTSTITVEVLDNSEFNVSFEVTVYVDPFIDSTFEGNTWISAGEKTQIKSVIRSGNGTIKYKSLDPEYATVDEFGKVTGVKTGYAQILAYLEEDESVNLTLGVTIVEAGMENIFDIIRKAHNTEIHVMRNLKVAYAYDTDVYNSVSDLLFNYDYKVDESLIIPTSHENRPGTKITTMEFITVHYTAGTPASSNAKATANYFNNTTAASANYCTGNDGIYMCIPDGEVAWHAGDGTSTKFYWTNTGVKATANVKPVWGVQTNSASSTGYYFTLNGQATTIEVPTTGKTSSGTIKTMTDPSKCFTFYGPAWKVVNGYYYMGNTWACFTQTLAGAISSRGGNLNSVGIETACNYGSDLWYTYQITAQLVARLLDKYNLDTTRVVGHNMFSGKDCPQTLLANDGELWYPFMECVEAEYALYELKLGDKYTISCKSNTPELVQDNGRLIKVPNYTQTASYTVTVKNNETGETKSETYSTIIHGTYTEK